MMKKLYRWKHNSFDFTTETFKECYVVTKDNILLTVFFDIVQSQTLLEQHYQILKSLLLTSLKYKLWKYK